MKKISFIIHGKFIGQSLLIKRLTEAFSKEYLLNCLFTQHPHHAIELARAEAEKNVDFVIAAGGDGTLNEVVNGVLQSGNSNVCVGLLPCGTGNDFAKTAGLKNDIQLLKGLVETGSIHKVDVGRIKYCNTENTNAERYFINIADVGMGGFIAKKINGYSKWMGATVTFQRAIVTTFFSYQKKEMVVESDSFSYSGKVMSLIVANGKYFGSGMGIAPDAKLDDGQFSVVVAADITLWDYLKKLPAVRRCEKIDHPQMKYAVATDITVNSVQEPLPIDMDGEFIGYTPMQIINCPGALNFLRPA